MECEQPILLVEDDPAERGAMTLVLELEGFRVAGAANGKEALDYLEHHPAPCLILLDLATPVLDGWGFREKQRQDPRLAGIPVVIVSGSANVQAEATTLGAAGFIQKPVEAEPLLGTVRLFATPRLPGVLLVEDRPAVAALVAAALRQHGFRVHKAASGPEALALYEQAPRDISLVLFDARMDGPHKSQALEAIQKLLPRVRCCWMNEETARQLADLGKNSSLSGLEEAAKLLRQMAPRG